jgi:hypothetical protein
VFAMDPTMTKTLFSNATDAPTKSNDDALMDLQGGG